MRAIAAGILAVGVMQGALAANASVGETDNGKTVALTIGQCLDVQLKTQAGSTGYDWYMARESTPLMKLEGRTLTQPAANPPMVGVPAELVFTLCAVKRGSGVVKFQLTRPWEKNTPPAKTLAFKVTIGS